MHLIIRMLISSLVLLLLTGLTGCGKKEPGCLLNGKINLPDNIKFDKEFGLHIPPGYPTASAESFSLAGYKTDLYVENGRKQNGWRPGACPVDSLYEVGATKGINSWGILIPLEKGADGKYTVVWDYDPSTCTFDHSDKTPEGDYVYHFKDLKPGAYLYPFHDAVLLVVLE